MSLEAGPEGLPQKGTPYLSTPSWGDAIFELTSNTCVTCLKSHEFWASPEGLPGGCHICGSPKKRRKKKIPANNTGVTCLKNREFGQT